jgi:DNA-binding NarL/FixJ family response regulator
MANEIINREQVRGSAMSDREGGAAVKRAKEIEVVCKSEDERDRLSLLTRRELEVYQLLELAKSDKEISSALGIAERTVHFHVSNVLRKEGLSRRIEILAKNRQ